MGRSGNLVDSKEKSNNLISDSKSNINVGKISHSSLSFVVNSNSPQDKVKNIINNKNDTACNITWKSSNPLARNETVLGTKCGNSIEIRGNLIKTLNSGEKFTSLLSRSGGNENTSKLSTKSSSNFSPNAKSSPSYESTNDIKNTNTKALVESRFNTYKLRPGNKIEKSPNHLDARLKNENNSNYLYIDKTMNKTGSADATSLTRKNINVTGLSTKTNETVNPGVIHKNTTVTSSKTIENSLNKNAKNSDVLTFTFINKKRDTSITSTKNNENEKTLKDFKDIQFNSKSVSPLIKPEEQTNTSRHLCFNEKHCTNTIVNTKNSDSITKKDKKGNWDSSDKKGKSFSSASEKGSIKEHSECKNNAFGSPQKNESNAGNAGEKYENSFDKEGTSNLDYEKTGDYLGLGIKSSFDTDEDNKYSNRIKSDNPLNPGDKSSTIPSGKSGKEENKLSNKSSNFTSAKAYESVSYSTPKSKKHKTSFGIIWIPTRKNKKKNYVYQPHKNDNYKERSPTMYPFMSGDSSENQQFKKIPEESELLVPDRIKPPPIQSSVSGIAGVGLPLDNIDETPERQEFIKYDQDESKEAAGDAYDHDDKDRKDDYLVNNEEIKSPDCKWEKEKLGDKVDSVYLRPPPPHKARSSASTPDEESCGLKCLYYTLQCCDCVIM